MDDVVSKKRKEESYMSSKLQNKIEKRPIDEMNALKHENGGWIELVG